MHHLMKLSEMAIFAISCANTQFVKSPFLNFSEFGYFIYLCTFLVCLRFYATCRVWCCLPGIGLFHIQCASTQGFLSLVKITV